MYKKYIELKSGGRIWIKPFDTANDDTHFQIYFYDKEGNELLVCKPVDQSKAHHIINLLIDENDIYDSIESMY